MSTIKFTVEDSKVSGILQDLLNSGVAVKNVEVTNTQHSKTTMVSELCSVEDLGSSFTLYRHGYSIGQNEGTRPTEIISGVKPVGGTIFYIDDTADGEYQFFDTWGNLVENVQVGDRPYYYKIIKEGSKDKFYVYHDKIYDNLKWTCYKDGDYVYELLDTSKALGMGRINTETVMTRDDGAYVTDDSDGSPTIWYQLQLMRAAKTGDCNDWFVPSVYEIEKLRKAILSGSVTGGKIAGRSYETSVFNHTWLHSSSEVFDETVWTWNHYSQYWFSDSKNDESSVFFIRAF